VNRLVVSPEAADDLHEIWLYLFREANRRVADRIPSQLVHSFSLLARNPHLGHKREDLTQREVFFSFALQYTVVYRLKNGVEVVAVLHGKRQLARALLSATGSYVM
jgi:plasmid stabilization system protein ParE